MKDLAKTPARVFWCVSCKEFVSDDDVFVRDVVKRLDRTAIDGYHGDCSENIIDLIPPQVPASFWGLRA